MTAGESENLTGAFVLKASTCDGVLASASLPASACGCGGAGLHRAGQSQSKEEGRYWPVSSINGVMNNNEIAIQRQFEGGTGMPRRREPHMGAAGAANSTSVGAPGASGSMGGGGGAGGGGG